MIRIIKNGKPNRKTKTIFQEECVLCGCIFEFENEDIERNHFNDVSIECPCCKRHLGIRFENLPKRVVEIDEPSEN